jgi:hypothetical protein
MIAAPAKPRAESCSNFNNLGKAAAGRVVTTLEFCSGAFCCGRAIWVSNFDQTPTAKEHDDIGTAVSESAHADYRSVLAIR